MTPRVCENCAIEDEDLVRVRRVYVTPERWDQPGRTEVVPEPELWCVPCATQYPCEVAEAEAAEDG